MENVLVSRGVTVVELARSYDSLDEEATRRLEALLRELAETAEPPLMVLDMGRTASIGSTFVGVLFAASKRLRRRRGHLALSNVEPNCAEVLHVVRSDAMFKRFATRDEAVDEIATTLAR